jgi:tetratricopeptide (TPR) repeat protein
VTENEAQRSRWTFCEAVIFREPEGTMSPLPSPAASNTKVSLAVSVFLVVATLTAFWPVTHHEFVNYDDDHYVTENRRVQQGLTVKNLVWAFTSTEVSNWHPLTWLSHMIDYELFGLDPAGHHAVSMVLHAVNTVLLFHIFTAMTGAFWQSAFLAAMFGLHPLHVESVAWVAERKDVLSAFFWILTIFAHARYARGPSRQRYFMVILFFALGLTVKPMLVTLPFVLLLLDYWPLGRLEARGSLKTNPRQGKTIKEKTASFARLVWEKIPLFVLAAGSSAVTLVAQQKTMATLDSIPLAIRIGNALVSYMGYLGKMFWPVRLAVFYPHPKEGLAAGYVLAAVLFLLALSSLALYFARKHPFFLVGWLWYLGTMVPVIGIVQVGGQAMADRYTYVPLLGIAIIVAWGVPSLIPAWRYRRVVLAGPAAAVILFFAVQARVQVGYWHDSLTLFQHALDSTEDNYLAHYNMGHALKNLGRPHDAAEHYAKVLSIRPYYVGAYNNLGNILNQEGKTEEAIAFFRKALEIDPDHVEALNNLGNALAAQGDLDGAVRHFSLALKAKPDFAGAHYNLGKALSEQGKLQEAITHFESVLEIEPENADAYNNLGVAWARSGRLEHAINAFTKALMLKPEFTQARENLEKAKRLAHR